MTKTAATNQSSTDDSNAAAGGDSGEVTSTPQSSSPRGRGGRRKKMLSFEPNADFFVVDSTATASTQATGDGSNRMRQPSHEKSRRRSQTSSQPLMGPILPRKKVLSMPLCSAASHDFFQGTADIPSIPISEEIVAEDGSFVSSSSKVQQQVAAAAAAQGSHAHHRMRQRQNTAPISGRAFFQAGDFPHDGAHPSPKRYRKKTNSFMAGVLARRAVAMDLLPADDADLGVYEFFRPQAATMGLEHYGEETKDEEEEEEEEEEGGKEEEVEDIEAGAADEEFVPQDKEEEVAARKKKLFKPLIFAPRKVMTGAAGKHSHPHGGGGAFCDVVSSAQQQVKKVDDTKAADINLTTDEPQDGKDVVHASEAIPLFVADDDVPKKRDEFNDDIEGLDEDSQDDTTSLKHHDDHSHIIRATKKDYFFTGFLFVVMCCLVGVVVGWSTHLDESDSIFGPVGLACKTPCRGDVYDQDYFRGRNQFNSGDIIVLTPHIDTTLTEESYLRMAIRGVQSNMTKWVSSDYTFGPASVEGKRVTKEARVTVNWENPEEQHVIDVWSTVSF